MAKQDDSTKEKSQRSISLKETKKRRKSMVLKVISFKIQSNKLSHEKEDYLKQLSTEAKWYYNYLIQLSRQVVTDDFGNLIYLNNLFQFNTKSNSITVFNYHEKKQVPVELKILSSQVKQEILKKITSSIKSLAGSKKKGRKTGRLRFQSLVNIPFKQFNNSFYLSDNAKKLKLQGNNKQAFHLIRNKNLTQFATRLNLTKKDKLNHQQISLQKLLDLKLIEIANAEIVPTLSGQFKFNLTVYFDHTSLVKSQLFQGTKLSVEDKEFINSLSVGSDGGMAKELTINVGYKYSSVSIDSKKLNKKEIGKRKHEKRFQSKLNKHISKAKKNNTTVKSRKYYEIKDDLNKVQLSMVNHKKDSVNKLTSVLDLCNQITFQDEMIKTWHQNKKMKFSKSIQQGIIGKVYAEWKNKYQEKDNKTNYQYKKLSRSLRTTKTCVCSKINNITLKDRVYYCKHCHYKNHRDTHSSYVIRNTKNHMDYQDENIKQQTGCGTQSVDQKQDGKTLLFDSTLVKTITNADTEKFYHILQGKLKSQNLIISFNNYEPIKPKPEAPSFRAV